MKVGRKIAVCIFTIIILVPVAFVSKCVYREKTLASKYGHLRRGTSKQEILDSMGSPDEIIICNANDDGRDYFIYLSFMERWGIVFDKQDKVTDKFYNAGSF